MTDDQRARLRLLTDKASSSLWSDAEKAEFCALSAIEVDPTCADRLRALYKAGDFAAVRREANEISDSRYLGSRKSVPPA